MKGFTNTLYGMIKKIKDFIGSTDISGISPTMTGAIATLNSDLNAKGKMLYNGVIWYNSTFPITVKDISKYNVFAAAIMSGNTSGSAIGFRVGTAIRFSGCSGGANVPLPTLGFMFVNGDTVTDLAFWSSYTQVGIGYIYGIA